MGLQSQFLFFPLWPAALEEDIKWKVLRNCPASLIIDTLLLYVFFALRGLLWTYVNSWLYFQSWSKACTNKIKSFHNNGMWRCIFYEVNFSHGFCSFISRSAWNSFNINRQKPFSVGHLHIFFSEHSKAELALCYNLIFLL